MVMREAKVEEHLGKLVAKLGGLYEKLTTGRVGPPDRLITLPYLGMELVELKKPKGGRLEKWQRRDHQKRALRGVKVSVIWTIEEADAWYYQRTFDIHKAKDRAEHNPYTAFREYAAAKIMGHAQRCDAYGDERPPAAQGEKPQTDV